MFVNFQKQTQWFLFPWKMHSETFRSRIQNRKGRENDRRVAVLHRPIRPATTRDRTVDTETASEDRTSRRSMPCALRSPLQHGHGGLLRTISKGTQRYLTSIYDVARSVVAWGERDRRRGLFKVARGPDETTAFVTPRRRRRVPTSCVHVCGMCAFSNIINVSLRNA